MGNLECPWPVGGVTPTMFHVLHDGETPELSNQNLAAVTDFDAGFLLGLLVGEGHFGGDGKNPQVTLRMHVRHSALFSWIERTFPGGRLYGPYTHNGRHYFQWMARGPFLRDRLLPLVDQRLSADLDTYSRERLDLMKTRYAKALGLAFGGTDGTPDNPASSASLPLTSTSPPLGLAGEQHQPEPVKVRLERIFSELRTPNDSHSSTRPVGDDAPAT